NEFCARAVTFKNRKSKIIYTNNTVKPPINPNSSTIIAKIKSEEDCGKKFFCTLFPGPTPNISPLAMAILALSIWYLSTSLSSEPKRSIRAVDVLNLYGIVSGKGFAAKKNNIPNKAPVARTSPIYFSGYLPTNNNMQQEANISAAVDKFDGAIGTTIAKTGNQT